MYILIAVPPAEIISDIDHYRQKYARYSARQRIVPHLTLFPPFYLKSEAEPKLVASVQTTFTGTPAGHIKVYKIGFFEGRNNVAFFAPVGESVKYLQSLHQKSKQAVLPLLSPAAKLRFESHDFHSHLTIVKQVPRSAFENIKKDLSRLSFDFSFQLESIWIYKLSPALGWQEFYEVKLTNFSQPPRI